MSYTSYTTYMILKKSFGYEKLVVYWLATTIYDLTVVFCDRFVDKRSRTHDQMVQASRSGKQNIVEGSVGRSMEACLKLSDVSRNSYGELLEDYKDFLRQHHLAVWPKDDPRILSIRHTPDRPYTTYTSYKSYTTYLASAEAFANLMVTLCYKQLFLMDRFIAANEKRFVETGGFRENLFRKRMEYKNRKP